MINFKSFYVTEAFLSADLNKALQLIQQELEKKLKTKLYQNPEIQHFENNVSNGFGIMYFLGNTTRAIRFNFSTNNEIVAVDIWSSDSTIPVISIDTKNVNIIHILSDIVEKIKEPVVEDIVMTEATKIVKVNKVTSEKILDSNEVKDAEKLVDKKQYADPKVIFDDLKSLIQLVVSGRKNSLIISGMAGMGKTTEIRNVAKENGLIEGKQYIVYSGSASPLGIYKLLYENNGKLIILDDINVFENSKTVDILKSALDSSKIRSISWISPNTFNASKLDSDEIAKEESKGKVPNIFNFYGKIIFITNIYYKEIDKALLSRSLVCDISLKAKDVIYRLASILPEIAKNNPEATMEKKNILLKYFKELIEQNKLQKDFSPRTYVNGLDIMLSGSNRWRELVERYS